MVNLRKIVNKGFVDKLENWDSISGVLRFISHSKKTGRDFSSEQDLIDWLKEQTISNGLADLKISVPPNIEVMDEPEGKMLEDEPEEKDEERVNTIIEKARKKGKHRITGKDLELIIKYYKQAKNERAFIDTTGQTYTLSEAFRRDVIRQIKGIEEISPDGSDKDIEELIIGGDKRRLTIRIVDITKIEQKQREKVKRTGAFFPYLLRCPFDLKRQGIFTEIDKDDYKDNCLIHALRVFGVSNAKLNNVILSLNSRNVRMCDVKHIANMIEKHIMIVRIVSDGSTIRKYYGDREKPEVKIGLIEDHYFLIERTQYTAYSIANYDEIKDEPEFNKIYAKKTNGGFRRSADRYIDSFQAVKYLVKNKDRYLKPISIMDGLEITQHYEDVKHDTLVELDVIAEPYKNYKARSPFGKNNKIVIYFDCEARTDAKIEIKGEEHEKHQAFMICYSQRYSDVRKTFTANDQTDFIEDFLKDITRSRRPVIAIAHNLRYDLQFMVTYLFNAHDMIRSGNKIRSLMGFFNGVQIMFKDSFNFISIPLRNFPPMFGFNEQKKEILPYKAYNSNSVDQKAIDIDYALSFVAEDDKAEFVRNINEWQLRDGADGKQFDHIRYCEIYCQTDCDVLKRGYETFRDWMLEITAIDIDYLVSVPQLANKFGIDWGVFDGVYRLKGTARAFIQRCVKGGRCMTRENKRWSTEERIQDFDAVSLYPSAMVQMGFLKGSPKILEPHQLNMEFLNKVDGYFIQIKITEVDKKLAFPLISYINGDGVRVYENKPQDEYYTNRIELEDLIKFQGIKFEIVRGYYFNEGRNDKIKDFIKFLFKERLKKKEEKNKIQAVYKLIMNAFYGKTIMKPITEKYTFKHSQEEFDKFIYRNYNTMKSYTEVVNYKGDRKCWIIKEVVSINDHKSEPHIGSEILAMSKRLMNRVMCLAEELNINIYYTDTDSIHIVESGLPLLEREFRVRYGKELVGKELGQFHCDFDFKADKKTLPVAIRSVFLGKKSYIDVVECIRDGQPVYEEHIRMKSIPSRCIKEKAKEEGCSVYDLYTNMFNGKKYEFDLTNVCKFKFRNDMTIINYKSFVRSVVFTD